MLVNNVKPYKCINLNWITHKSLKRICQIQVLYVRNLIKYLLCINKQLNQFKQNGQRDDRENKHKGTEKFWRSSELLLLSHIPSKFFRWIGLLTSLWQYLYTSTTNLFFYKFSTKLKTQKPNYSLQLSTKPRQLVEDTPTPWSDWSVEMHSPPSKHAWSLQQFITRYKVFIFTI